MKQTYCIFITTSLPPALSLVQQKIYYLCYIVRESESKLFSFKSIKAATIGVKAELDITSNSTTLIN